MKRFFKFIRKISLTFGCVFLVSPIFSYWLIHGDYERYTRIINGPSPFNKFGSGPFQLCLFIGLIMLSIIFFAISFLIKKIHNILKEEDESMNSAFADA